MSARVLKSVDVKITCPHCHKVVAYSKTPEQAREEAAHTLAALDGFSPTQYIRPAGGE